MAVRLEITIHVMANGLGAINGMTIKFTSVTVKTIKGISLMHKS